MTNVEQHKLNESLLDVIYSGDLEKTKELIQKGASIFYKHHDGWKLAIEKGHLDIVKLLLEKGVSIDCEKKYGVFVSSKKHHHDVLMYLIERGANFENLNRDLTLNAMRAEDVNILRFLDNKGVDILIQKEDILKVASELLNADIAKYYAVEKNQGVDFIIKNNFSCPDTFSWALKYKEMSELKEKIEKGLTVKQENKKMKI